MEGAPLPPGETGLPPEPKDGLRAAVKRRAELS